MTFVVLGILAMVALPRMTATSVFDERAFADKLKATIEFSRNSAVAKRRYTCVSISGASASFTLDTTQPESATGACGATALTLPSGGSTLAPPSGVTLASSVASIVFDPQGNYGGAADVTISVGTTTVKVTSGTGYVH